MTEETVFDKAKNFIIGNAWTSFEEINRLLPDSILFGSILMYIITQNVVFSGLALFVIELMLSHKAISNFEESVSGKSPVKQQDLKCTPGYRAVRMSFDRIFMNNKWPSMGVFSVTGLATYILAGMSAYKETLESMGSAWNTRYWISLGFAIAFVLLFVLLRAIKGCESSSEIIIASLFGIMVGLFGYLFNKLLLGEDSMNFLGLPYLISKDTEKSQPIYICSPNLE
jgi:hypothetical protein